MLFREIRSTNRNLFPCSHLNRNQSTVSRNQSKSRNKIFEKSHPESNPVGFSRQRSV